MNRPTEIATTLLLGALVLKSAEAADKGKELEPKAPHTLEEVANGYYQLNLSPEVLSTLCDYSKKYGNTMTPDCKDLPVGAKVVFPRNRELQYLTCDKEPDPLLCKAYLFFISDEEKTDPVFTNLDQSHQYCVERLREQNPTLELGDITVASRMIYTSLDGKEGWESNCGKSDLKIANGLIPIPKDSATLTKEGWVVEEHLR